MKKLPIGKHDIRYQPHLNVSRIVRSSYKGLKRLPSDLNTAGMRLFLLISKCFQQANDVREAPILELLWGLSKGGYDTQFLMQGLRDLHEKHYVALTNDMCQVLDLSTVNNTSKVWYMLADKWLDLLVPPESLESGIFPEVFYGTVRLDGDVLLQDREDHLK